MSDLDRRLTDLGRHLTYPETPELSGAVSARISTARRESLRPFRPARALAMAAAVAIVVVGALPPARETVAGWLGIEGLIVEVTDAGPLGGRLELTGRTTLEAARVESGLPLDLPVSLGQPSEVYLDEQGRVWLAYAATSRLPEVESTGVGALLTVFDPARVAGFLKQVADPAGQLTVVDLDGRPALWIEGQPHAVFVLDTDGRFFEDQGRLAGNALVWEAEAATYRLEAAIELTEAIEIARSLP